MGILERIKEIEDEMARTSNFFNLFYIAKTKNKFVYILFKNY